MVSSQVKYIFKFIIYLSPSACSLDSFSSYLEWPLLRVDTSCNIWDSGVVEEKRSGLRYEKMSKKGVEIGIKLETGQ